MQTGNWLFSLNYFCSQEIFSDTQPNRITYGLNYFKLRCFVTLPFNKTFIQKSLLYLKNRFVQLLAHGLHSHEKNRQLPIRNLTKNVIPEINCWDNPGTLSESISLKNLRCLFEILLVTFRKIPKTGNFFYDKNFKKIVSNITVFL